jgi:hypothetical protein
LNGVGGCDASGKCVMGVRSMFSTSGIEEQDYAMLFQDGQVLMDVELVFPSFRNLLCRGSMHERYCQGLGGYVLIVFRRRLGWCPGRYIWFECHEYGHIAS